MLSARVVFVTLLALPTALAAQQARSTDPWTLRLRAAISGTSYDSEPTGYKIYSGIGLEGAVQRRLGAVTALELSFRTESREVTGPEGAGDNRLGSLEMFPVTLLARWVPRGRGDGAFQPYLGAGAALTTTWEKSGALDSSDTRAAVSPALGLGTDFALSPRTVLNLDVKWNTFTARITKFRTPEPAVKIDPLTFGVGFGVRF